MTINPASSVLKMLSTARELFFWNVCAAMIFCTVASIASGQEAEPEAEPEEAPAEAVDAPPPVDSDSQILHVPIRQDTITFKSGRILTNVQILKATPQFYEVQMFEDTPPVRFKRQLIESVDWDGVDPVREKLENALKSDDVLDSQISAQQLSAEFRARLTAPISDQPLSFDQRPLVQVFDELTARSKVVVDVHQSIRDLPAERKLWTFELKPGVRMLTVLQDEFPKAFPNFRVLFEFDKVTIVTAQEAEARSAGEAPAEPADAANPVPQ